MIIAFVMQAKEAYRSGSFVFKIVGVLLQDPFS
jgi:hypothetical protein